MSQRVPAPRSAGGPAMPPAQVAAGAGASLQPDAAAQTPAMHDTMERDASTMTARDAAPSADDAGTAPGSEWQTIACKNGFAKVFSQPIELTREVDFFGLYGMRPEGYGGPGPIPAAVYAQDALGRVCATTTDAASCKARVDALLVPSEDCKSAKRICPAFGVTTRGDEVVHLDTKQELMQLLGTIDVPQKAVIAAFWEGMALDCWRDDTQTGTRIAFDAAWSVQSAAQCPEPHRQTIVIAKDGTVLSNMTEIFPGPRCATGRRPAGLRSSASRSTGPRLGAYLAEVAQLEAASVLAFERIAAELAAFGAPLPLAAAAEAAAADERRHAGSMAELARAFGAEPTAPQIEAQTLRARFEFALDNAVEGCVRETFGAALAHYQAARASDPAIAAAMTRIAEDETRHAELSWQIADWLAPQLTVLEREALARARATAFEALANELTLDGFSDSECQLLGWPARDIATALLDRLATELAA